MSTEARLWGPLNFLYRGSSLVVKWPGGGGGDVEHSATSRTEVKNEWRYTSIPPVYLLCVDRDNHIFLDLQN
jgi:hypothetical protein